jgi:hypothetical protein
MKRKKIMYQLVLGFLRLLSFCCFALAIYLLLWWKIHKYISALRVIHLNEQIIMINYIWWMGYEKNENIFFFILSHTTHTHNFSSSRPPRVYSIPDVLLFSTAQDIASMYIVTFDNNFDAQFFSALTHSLTHSLTRTTRKHL